MAETGWYVFLGMVIIGALYMYFYIPDYETHIPLVIIFTFGGIALGGAFV